MNIQLHLHGTSTASLFSSSGPSKIGLPCISAKSKVISSRLGPPASNACSPANCTSREAASLKFAFLKALTQPGNMLYRDTLAMFLFASWSIFSLSVLSTSCWYWLLLCNKREFRMDLCSFRMGLCSSDMKKKNLTCMIGWNKNILQHGATCNVQFTSLTKKTRRLCEKFVLSWIWPFKVWPVQKSKHNTKAH